MIKSRILPGIVGKQIEEEACIYLKNQGLSFIDQNVRFKVGEIDLIMKHRDMLVFVEVRYRAQNTYGSGLESISTYKKNRLLRATQWYLLKNRWAQQMPCRFDVISVSGGAGARLFEWIENVSLYY